MSYCFRTWPGPSWTPISTLSSLLLTIQSMMVENPIYNEPGVNRTGVSFFFRLVHVLKIAFV